MPVHLEPRPGAPSQAYGLAGSVATQRLLVIGADEALLVSVPELEPLARLEIPGARLQRACFSADGQRLAVTSSAGLHLFDADGQLLAQLPELNGQLALSADASWVAAQVGEESLLLTELKAGPRRARLIERADSGGMLARPAAFSPDGERLALSLMGFGDHGIEHAVAIRDVATGRAAAALPGERAPAWGPGGALHTVAPDARELRARSVPEGSAGLSEVERVPLSRALDGLDLQRARFAWSPHRRWLLAWDMFGARGPCVIDAATGALLSEQAPGGGAISSVEPWSEGLLAVRRSSNDGLELWDTQTWELVAELRPATELTHAAVAPDGAWVLVALTGEGAGLSALRAADAEALGRWPGAHTPAVMSPDGGTLAFATEADDVQLWDTRRHRPGLTLRGHDDRILQLDWAPDSRTLLSSGGDQRALIWSPDDPTPRFAISGEERLSFYGPTGEFSPELGLVAVVGPDDDPEPGCVLDPRSGALTPLPDELGCLIGWLDDEHLVALLVDQRDSLGVWSWRDGALVDALDLGEDALASAMVAGGRIVAAGEGAELLLWAPLSGQPARRLEGPAGLSAWTLGVDGALAALGRGQLLAWDAAGALCVDERGVGAFTRHPLGPQLWAARGSELLRFERDGALSATLPGWPHHRPLAMCMSTDGRVICTHDRRAVALWSEDGPRELWRPTPRGVARFPIAGPPQVPPGARMVEVRRGGSSAPFWDTLRESPRGTLKPG